ncbi:unnamed protein product [Paramecium octaurelia]|uniref:Uncharacterized protein n=1 Tax=Paramecium octaurelia TaxID=43137 RepID=A0A8S1UWE8_PAROT|nr:unnamed protein product [Paramecium octaurelia]
MIVKMLFQVKLGMIVIIIVILTKHQFKLQESLHRSFC